MGLTLNMDNLHAPTVLSGPTSGTAANNGMQTDGLTFEELRSLKYNTEAELEALSGVLDSAGHKSSHKSLC
ncbi:hypothetical protein EYC84_006672 [Monilinia fructicola]|uniref:Uncharacterized protein n=1 Tax=Monilinia fructicola TaxID=38448 RepID=A0A5M9K7W0_MONFR|nr:hypothetical protein EYC84_006672 [Monilinia fructicola]